jgi:hypothetical protein
LRYLQIPKAGLNSSNETMLVISHDHKFFILQVQPREPIDEGLLARPAGPED